MRSFYDILEVSPSASTAEIRASYLKLAREYHPDRVPEYLTKLRADAEEKVKEINEAWAVLGDPTKRRKYDLKLESNADTSPHSSSTANPSRPARYPPPQGMAAILEWFHTRRDVLRWALVIGIGTLVLVVVGELIAFRGIKSQSSASQPGVAADNPEPQRTIRYDLKPVQFQTSQFAGRDAITFHSFSITLSDRKSMVTFQVSSADRRGFLLYEPPGGSTRTRKVMGKTVVVDQGFEEPYLLDDGGRKYYSTSGLLGGEQVNFDLYNFTRRINVTSQQDLSLSAEFPPLGDGVSSVTFVLPALGKWQPEWRFPRFDLR